MVAAEDFPQVAEVELRPSNPLPTVLGYMGRVTAKVAKTDARRSEITRISISTVW
jgi:hypothetical protein